MDEHRLYESETCLSQNVYETVCQDAVYSERSEPLPSNSGVSGISHCLSAKGFIDWEQLTTFLPDQEDTSEFYKQCARSLSPLFHQIQLFYHQLTSEDFLSSYDNQLSWISQKSTVFRCFELLKDQSQTASIHTLLLITALVERGLGDLVLLKAKHCPLLLKDLLNHDDLSTLLSPNIMLLLKILIGPPISLNLRNLVWHGFPSPSEIKTQFAYSLLCVIVSIGDHLMENDLMTKISFRQQFFAVSLPQIFPDLSLSRIEIVRQTFCESRLVSSSLWPLWMMSLQLFAEKRFGECVVVLMPQFEHALRRVFIAANNCPQRLMTAETKDFFTTFDEILNKYLDGCSENQFRNFVGDSYMNLLLDFLAFPAGPRVRDHLSHGEVIFTEVPEVTASHLIWLCYIITVRFVPNYPARTQNEFDTEIANMVNEYESLFHPLSIVKKKIIDLAEKLSVWSSLPRIDASLLSSDTSASSRFTEPELSSPSCIDSHSKLSDESSLMKAALAFERFLLSCGSRHLTDAQLIDLHQILEPLRDCSTLVKGRLSELRLNTIFRYQKASLNDQEVGRICSPGEEELLGILSKVFSALSNSSDQICNVLNLRYKQWKNKELRSRQRNTYARMLKGFEKISDALRLILYQSICLIFQLDDLNCEKSSTLIKFMKKVQKYSENLKVQTDISCNIWDEAVVQSLHLITMTVSVFANQ